MTIHSSKPYASSAEISEAYVAAHDEASTGEHIDRLRDTVDMLVETLATTLPILERMEDIDPRDLKGLFEIHRDARQTVEAFQ